MPRAYPDEFRVRAVSLIRAGQSVRKTASDLDVSCAILHRWVKQEKIYRGELPGVPLAESRSCVKHENVFVRRENEVEILRRAHDMLGSSSRHPKGFTR